MPAIFEPLGLEVRTGKRAPREDTRTLQMAPYIVGLPRPPRSIPVPPHVPSWPMFGNDRYGDCTIAAYAHLIQLWASLAGTTKTPTEADVEAAYWATGVPPTPGADDNGRVELDVLNYMRHTGLGGDTIEAYVQVKPEATAHVKLACYLFGGVYIGLSLPLSAQAQKVWDVASGPSSAPGSWGGHAVPIVGYTTSRIAVVTWGSVVWMTWRFFRRYCDEAYALLSPDMLVDGLSHSLNDTQLLADLRSL